MKTLKCRDLGERTCNFLASGETTEEVERKYLDHIETAHHTFIESMDIDDREKLLEQMESMVETKGG